MWSPTLPGSDDLVINGSKMWITNGAQADWICLLANTSDGAPHRNKSLICVPMDTPGVTVARKIEKLGEGGREFLDVCFIVFVLYPGNHSSDTAEIFFEDVVVPASNVIGELGSGFTYQMIQFQEERMWAIASGGCGLLLWDTTYPPPPPSLSIQFSSPWRGPSRRQLSTVGRGRPLEKASLTTRYIAPLMTNITDLIRIGHN